LRIGGGHPVELAGGIELAAQEVDEQARDVVATGAQRRDDDLEAGEAMQQRRAERALVVESGVGRRDDC
jgi:hypothetical protein